VHNTIVPFRDGLETVVLNCGDNLKVESCSVNDVGAPFIHKGNILRIRPGVPLPPGEPAAVAVHYVGIDSGSADFSAERGFHWIQRDGGDKARVGFWTQGESELTRTWIPTWDNPNNLATSETRTTVPADWTVIGNGVLVSNKLCADRKTRTFDWRMAEPHATYLLSLAGGPFDVKTVHWRGIL
jgi:aminopeptidase N